MRILFVEDEVSLSRAVSAVLRNNRFEVEQVYNGTDALAYMLNGRYDCVLLDIMLPDMDGVNVLRRARAAGSRTPVIMLTARGEIDDKVLGLDSGANDYMTKPYDIKELMARIRAVTRMSASADSLLKCGNVTLDRSTCEMIGPGGSFRLTGKEFQVMETLMLAPDVPISTERLMERGWGYDSSAEINVVWVYISYLRRKLRAIGADVEIRSIRSEGYILEARA